MQWNQTSEIIYFLLYVKIAQLEQVQSFTSFCAILKYKDSEIITLGQFYLVTYACIHAYVTR
jgi:hypothetical protein